MRSRQDYCYRNKTSGFTLIELLLALFISTLVIGSFVAIFDFSIRAADRGQAIDDLSETGVHLLTTINDEIEAASAIYSASRFDMHSEYRNSLGFVLQTKVAEKFRYVYFALRGETLYRIAYNSVKSNPRDISFRSLYFSGENAISDNVLSIEGSGIDFDTKLTHLRLQIGKPDSGKIYETSVYRKEVTDF